MLRAPPNVERLGLISLVPRPHPAHARFGLGTRLRADRPKGVGSLRRRTWAGHETIHDVLVRHHPSTSMMSLR